MKICIVGAGSIGGYVGVKLAQAGEDLLGHRRQRVLLRQWQHRHLIWSESWVEAQHRARLVVNHVFVIGRKQECCHGAIGAGRRLHDVRHVAFVRRLVEVFEALLGELRVTLQVEIGALGDAFEFEIGRAHV